MESGTEWPTGGIKYTESNRIDIEVKGALRNAENFEQRCQDKAKVLDRILQAMHGEPVSDRQLFLVDIKESTNYSWSQIMPDTASFQEIVSAGKLNLIKNQKLRTQISREYRRIEARWELIENRRTDYAPALNRLIINDDFLSEADIAETTDAILKANLKPALIAEINRNDYMIEEYEVMGARLKLLLDQIQIELNELEGND